MFAFDRTLIRNDDGDTLSWREYVCFRKLALNVARNHHVCIPHFQSTCQVRIVYDRAIHSALQHSRRGEGYRRENRYTPKVSHRGTMGKEKERVCHPFGSTGSSTRKFEAGALVMAQTEAKHDCAPCEGHSKTENKTVPCSELLPCWRKKKNESSKSIITFYCDKVLV